MAIDQIVAEELTRLITAKADLKTSIEAKGVTVPSSATLDNYANYVDAISVGATLQAKTNITPTESSQTITADNGYDGLSSVQINAISSSYVGSGITRRDVYDLTASGSTVTVPSGYYANGAQKSVGTGTAKPATSISANAATVSVGTNTITLSKTAVSNTPQVTAGYISSGTSGDTDISLTASVNTRSSSDLTVSGAQITAPAGYYASSASKSVPNASFTGPEIILQTGATISTVPSTNTIILKKQNVNMDITSTGGYVGNSIDVTTDEIQLRADCAINNSSSLTVSGATVTAPAGYYSSDVTKTIASGSATPAASISGSSATVEANGIYNTLTLTKTISNTPQVTAGYISSGTSGNTEVSLTADIPIRTSISGLNGVDEYVVIANNGYYPATTSHSIPHGTTGTPTATKGTVSNHSVSVTPSVTNTTGYITGSTINGTAVSVSASELVSGTYTVIDDGTFDITNYASLSVPGMSLPTSAVSSTSYELMRANFLPSESTRYIEIPKGFHDVDQYYMLDPVSSTYVGSGITRRSSSDLTASNLTVTAPSGYYASNATKTLTDANLLATNIKKDVSIFGVTGTYEGSGSGGGSVVAIDSKSTTPSSAGSSISFTGLSGEPTSFIVYTTSDLATGASPFKVAAVVFDGTDLHGQTITNTSNAQVTYDGSSFSKTYSNGTLTITSTGAYFQAQQYRLDYSYGGSSSDIHTADVQVGSGATSITFSNLEGEPIYISLIFKSNFSTSNGYQRAIWVADKLDGEGPFGMAMDSSAHYTSANYRNNGSGTTVTINSSSTNAGGYFHQPGYYQLTYVVPSDGSPYQKKTVTPTTSQQIITADTGYDALSQVTVNAIPSSFVQPTTTVGSTTYRASTSDQTISSGTYHSAAATIAAVTQTNLTAANIKSGTTITISNGQSNLWSVTGTYTGGGSGGSFSVATTTWNNSTNTTTSHEFTGLSGTPKFAVLRCTSQLTRSSSNTYYYIADIVWNGTAAYGNYHLRSNGSFNNVASNATTKFTVTTGTNRITFTSGGSRGGAPGAFYNGTYELTYVY